MFISGIFLGGEDSLNLQLPPTAAKLCALNLFFRPDNELQICHGNFLLMDNKRRKLFVIRQSKGCKFLPKMRQNTLAHTRQGAYALPRSPSRNGGLLLRRRGKRRGPTSKEYGREGREERGDVNRAEGNTCKVQASRINTV